MMSTAGKTLSGATALFGVMLAVGCALNPVTGNREFVLVSESQEIEMGRQGSADVIAAYGLVPDAALQTYVNRIGQTLAAKTERPQLAWEFHVVDDAAVNAFALPGGYIFVTRGLLTHMTNEAEIASVLGHEAGHVAARHSVQQISRQQIASLGLGLGSVLSPVIAKYGEVVGAGLGLLFLKYSRDDETQADHLGFRYALADGYDTREMISVFQMLQEDAQLSGGGGRLPEWQSTHPDPGNRIADVQGMVAASTQNFSAMKVGGDEFLQRIDGMVYGENPRAGYFKGGLFIHPDLKFVLEFPEGWTTLNAVDAVTGISDARDAVIQLRGAQGSAAEAARGFFAQEGLQAGAQSQVTIHGNRASTGEFTAQTDQGAVHGLATFIEYGGATWGIVAYAVAERFTSYRPMFQRSMNSFDRLTDPVALAVQPMHLRVDHAPRAMTLQQFNAQLPSSISIAELAMINGLDQGAQLRAGQPIKRVIGTPVARDGPRP